MSPPRLRSWRNCARRRDAADRRDRLVARSLVDAAATRDRRLLGRLLAPRVELVVDGGGRVTAPTTPLSGRASVEAYLAQTLFAAEVVASCEVVNARPGIVLRHAGEVTGVLAVVLAPRRGRVERAWLMVNPDKLRHWTGRS